MPKSAPNTHAQKKTHDLPPKLPGVRALLAFSVWQRSVWPASRSQTVAVWQDAHPLYAASHHHTFVSDLQAHDYTELPMTCQMLVTQKVCTPTKDTVSFYK